MRSKDILSTIYYKDKSGNKNRVHLVRDSDPEDPRQWDGHLSQILLVGSRYGFGDRNNYSSSFEIQFELGDEFLTDQEVNGKAIDDLSSEELWSLLADKIYVLKVFVYEHGDIRISCGKSNPFNDRWDSGCVGYAYVAKDKILDSGIDVDWNTDDWHAVAEKIITEEINELDMWINNEVYGYVNEHQESDGEWMEDDSCWGFYPSEENRWDYSAILWEHASYNLGITNDMIYNPYREITVNIMEKLQKTVVISIPDDVADKDAEKYAVELVRKEYYEDGKYVLDRHNFAGSEVVAAM